ncbi:MAG TPA: SRPBCC domain-containing protein [Bacteroidota bacterium]
MTANNSPETTSHESGVVVTRIFDAPRALVWKAWTDPQHLMKWWGPKNFTLPTCKVDLRVGGKYLFCMRSPKGEDLWSTGTYREVVPREKLVYIYSFADEKGNIVPASHYWMGVDLPLEMKVIITFEDHQGKTKMTLRHIGLPAGEMEEMTSVGWNESFDKLAASLK